MVTIFQSVGKYQYHGHSIYLYKFQCLKCSVEFTKQVSSDELHCPNCDSSMTVLVSSPGKQDKPVFTVGHVGRFVAEHVGAAELNTSSIKTLNGDMSVTALVQLSTSSSSSSYLEAEDQTQESEKTDSVDLTNKNMNGEQYVYLPFSNSINNSLSLNKAKHDRGGFWRSDLN